MAWEFVGSTSGAGTANNYTVSLNGTLTGGIASSPAEGDLVVVFSGFGNTASSAPNISGNNSGAYTPATAAQHVNDTWDTEFRSFYMVMGSSPDTSLTVTRTTNGAYGGATVVHVWRGVDTSNPFIGAATPASGTNTSLVNPPAYNPGVTDALIIAGGAGTQATTGAAFTGFTGMSNFRTQKGDGTTSDIDVAMASYLYAGVSYDPPVVSGGTGGNASSSWAGVTIAFRMQPEATNYTWSVSGSLTPSGDLSNKLSLKRLYQASITMTGSLVASLVTGTLYLKSLASTLTLTGVVRRKTTTSKKVGSITPSATISRRLFYTKLLVGAVTLSGTIRRKITKRYTGAITAVGIARKKVMRRLASLITASGTVKRKILKKFLGSITGTAIYSARVVIQRLYSSSLTPSGSVSNGGVITPVPDNDKASILNFLRRFIGRR